MLQLSFAGYKRAGKFGYKILAPGKVQVPGFTEADTHQQVTMKGAKGLGIDRPIDQLSLLISSSLVKDTPLPSNKPWTLGNYTQEFGGSQARGKRTFGIYVPYDEGEDVMKISNDYDYDEVLHSLLYALHN